MHKVEDHKKSQKHIEMIEAPQNQTPFYASIKLSFESLVQEESLPKECSKAFWIYDLKTKLWRTSSSEKQ
ncbi:hypothetical protein ACEZ3G_00145 [Maribacter algicola]|uniref:Uncharacterized protein n=1 Tax=Meishania litoralis TaxID=3434685 RepID=A0ACC7LEU4_9FLAO